MSQESHETTAASTDPSPSLLRDTGRVAYLLDQVYDEMVYQDQQWTWPRPVGHLTNGAALDEMFAKVENASRFLLASGAPSWAAILGEEIGEVTRATGSDERIDELVQVAAVALSWAQAELERKSS